MELGCAEHMRVVFLENTNKPKKKKKLLSPKRKESCGPILLSLSCSWSSLCLKTCHPF